MIGHRCKCGKATAWTSGMVLHDCEGCSECGTTYATHPDGHRPLQMHDFEERYLDSPVTAPEIRRVCRRCHHVERSS